MDAGSPVAVPPPLPVHRQSPLVGFFIDLGLALGLIFALSMVFTLGLAVWEGFAALREGRGDIDRLLQEVAQPDGVALVWLTLLATGSAALIVYALRGRASTPERQASRAALRRPATWGWTLLVGLGVLLGSAAIGWAGEQLGSQPVPTNEALIKTAFAQSPVFLVVFAALLAPAYEELLFRRVLFGRLWRAGRTGLGYALSSVSFALVHELPGLSANPWPATLQLWLTYGLMGWAFAWVYRRTGTLWAAIGAHVLNNALAVALLVAGTG
ncbi:CPBP family intramembrane metalloprotease [Lysobacter sp. SG-8]|uniref:CPBP family intramembrane metalloprotease n=1 Tax=Marilutibacter penaei TaxID=2759900 RepID=A0A7W3U490_9GAMM|nr:CPBP family intramembrane glutamic endopeptidase [Lysobacter penaei]MBB1088661.1 CPBP family intramembrane metalloprotease [Lysobacter penaei]